MLIRGDARSIPLLDGVVDCVVTSPPYYGLRNYEQDTRQIGLEVSIEAYTSALVDVFREVRRVLRPRGTVWLNLGDCYGRGRRVLWSGDDRRGTGFHARKCEKGEYGSAAGINAEKQLLGVPWRVAFALQADGWILRSEVIWDKPNPMPESVTDRPTRSHEQIFLFAKTLDYFYNARAIAEPVSWAMQDEVRQGYDGEGVKDYAGAGVQNPSSVKRRIIDNARKRIDPDGPRNGLTRNKRSVWRVTVKGTTSEHFATFPEDLVEPCILAGSPLDGIVLDPFVGTGTVVAVADRLSRFGIGLDLNYLQIAREHTAQRGLKFGSEASSLPI